MAHGHLLFLLGEMSIQVLCPFFLKYGWYTVLFQVYSEVIQLHLYMYFTDSIIAYYKILNIVP